MQGLKSAILAIFLYGRIGCALLVQPSRIPCWISKILFVLGSYEFLAMLEGKVRKGFFLLGFKLVKKTQCSLVIGLVGVPPFIVMQYHATVKWQLSFGGETKPTSRGRTEHQLHLESDVNPRLKQTNKVPKGTIKKFKNSTTKVTQFFGTVPDWCLVVVGPAAVASPHSLWCSSMPLWNGNNGHWEEEYHSPVVDSSQWKMPSHIHCTHTWPPLRQI